MSGIADRDIACGDYNGNLVIYDLETGKEKFRVKAHSQIINAIDGVGGKGPEYGTAEIVTGSRDGCVTVWDPRQTGKIVSLEPAEKSEVFPDCWAVCFGNNYNTEERVLAAGYDNGDLKIFDLRQNMLLWDTNLKNAVCGLEFDRKDIPMNKLAATTLESKCHIFDVKTFHPEQGYAFVTELPQNSTIWGAKHLPQNRDIFMTHAGNGGLNLYKYNYPPKRFIKDEQNLNKGVPGTLTLLNESVISTQPVASFDWSPDKIGLGCLCCLDQTAKVVIVTKLHTY
jgi:WD40 repeat protein